MAPSKDVWRYFPALLALLLFITLWCLWQIHRAPIRIEAWQIEHATFTTIDHSTETSIQLPHTWHDTGHLSAEGTYRLTLALETPPQEVWALYIPRLSGRLQLAVNHQTINPDIWLQNTQYRLDNRPLLLLVPAALLVQGDNLLELSVAADIPRQGNLSALYFGPAEQLLPVHSQLDFYKYRLSQFIVVLLLIMAALMTALWRLRPNESIYGWYALASFAWAVHTLDRVIVNLPIAAHWWDWLMVISLLWLPVLCALFIHRHLKVQYPVRERLAMRLLFILTILLLLLPTSLFYKSLALINNLTLILGLYPVALLAWFRIHQPQGDVRYLMITGLFMVVLGGHDAMVVNQWIDNHQGFLMHYSAPLVLTVFTGILLRRFVEALSLSENLSRDLEQRIQQKHNELAANYAQLQQLERERVLTAERERLTRDMHDGIGGHLVSLMAQLEGQDDTPEAVMQGLREALDDLRLMIDSMEDIDGDLLAILGMFRGRIEPRLEQAGITLNWRVTDLPPLPELGPEKALHILRILQEALTNCLRHARASEVTLSTGCQIESNGQQRVFIEISDNGCGFKPQNNHHNGRGLKHLQRRAQMIGGDLTLTSTHQGTQLHLSMPV